VHPNWPELAAASPRERTSTYYNYSCRETHYRSPAQVLDIFRGAGFAPHFESHRHARIERLGLQRIVPKPLLSWLLTNFAGCVLVCRKPRREQH
jgi:hypothetical protein